MPSLRHWLGWPMRQVRAWLGYEIEVEAHLEVDLRLQAQRLRLNALDAAIQAQNAAPVYRGHERRKVPR